MARKKSKGRGIPRTQIQRTSNAETIPASRLPEEIASHLAEEHYNILRLHYRERLRQCRMVSTVTLALLSLGILIILIGIILFFTDHTSSGIITTASGVISDIITGIIFKFNKDSNDRLDVIAQNMSYFERVRTSEVLLNKITDVERRNQLIDDLIRSMLQMTSSDIDDIEQEQPSESINASDEAY